MLSLLEKFDYKPPVLQEGNFGSVDVELNKNGCYYLFINNKKWMAYNIITHLEAYQLYSHYKIAEGHVIVSGLGFGARENWLLTKKEVTKLTIIERSEDLINYHKKIESPFLKDTRVEIINCDASNYSGSCDVLLLDHYELETYEDILSDVKKIHDNVSCKKMWFWPFERIISRPINFYRLNKLDHCNYTSFNILKEKWELYKIPDFSEQEIDIFCKSFISRIL